MTGLKLAAINQKHSLHGISALVPETLFRGETHGCVTKCQLSSTGMYLATNAYFLHSVVRLIVNSKKSLRSDRRRVLIPSSDNNNSH